MTQIWLWFAKALAKMRILTYKSIEQGLKAEDGRNLYRLELPEGVSVQRRMYVQASLATILNELTNSFVGSRHIALRDLLDGYCCGDHFTVSEQPYSKPSHVMLSRVDPTAYDIWSFRCTWPGPGMRVAGMFGGCDCFVALGWDYRENLDDDGAWDAMVRDCKVTWRQLFGDLPPHQGSHIHDYISSNVEIVQAGRRPKNSRRNS
jgi:hypothetical protein